MYGGVPMAGTAAHDDDERRGVGRSHLTSRDSPMSPDQGWTCAVRQFSGQRRPEDL